MGIEIDGLDEFQKRLDEMVDKVNDLAAQQEVAIEDLMPPSFMQANTDFNSVAHMFEESPYEVSSGEDFAAIPDDEWDVFIRSRTQFDSWQAMQETAAGEWAKKKLDL